MDLQSLTVTGKGYSKIYSENPFYEEPPPKAFYYPSKERQLSNSERKTALSPERAGDRSSRKQPQAPEQKFLSGSHNIKPLSSIHQHGSKSPPSAKFDESWPESERPSSPSILTADESKLDASPTARFQTLPVHPSTSDLINSALSAGRQAHQLSKQTEKPTEKAALAAKAGRERTSIADTSAEKGSVLQRYIERFRHGAPMSREERLQEEGNKKKEFWWLGSDPPTPQSTSTPKQEEGRSVSLTSQERCGGLTVENLRKRDRLDEVTEQLQQKAERLLSSAHSIGSTEPIVSTIGLGSTGSDVSSFSEPAVRPAFIPRQYSAGRDAGQWTNRLPPSAKDSEGDILYKWRLQRKLEQAREGVSAPVSVKSAPKTQAEQEMSSRLAAFREKLLQRPTAAATEVRHAQVERVIRETQRQVYRPALQQLPLGLSHAEWTPPPSLTVLIFWQLSVCRIKIPFTFLNSLLAWPVCSRTQHKKRNKNLP